LRLRNDRVRCRVGNRGVYEQVGVSERPQLVTGGAAFHPDFGILNERDILQVVLGAGFAIGNYGVAHGRGARVYGHGERTRARFTEAVWRRQRKSRVRVCLHAIFGVQLFCWVWAYWARLESLKVGQTSATLILTVAHTVSELVVRVFLYNRADVLPMVSRGRSDGAAHHAGEGPMSTLRLRS